MRWSGLLLVAGIASITLSLTLFRAFSTNTILYDLTNPDNVTSRSPSKQLDQRFCRSDQLTFPSATATAKRNFSQPVWYQCLGKAYDKFTSRLERYVRRKQGATEKPWGKRDFPFPANSNILTMGNSHTRQTLLTLLCQYLDQVTDFRVSSIHGANLNFIQFANNASLFLVMNSPLVYSSRWPDLLKQYDPLKRSLADYDAVILGAFNNYAPGDNTAFQRQILDFEKEHPDEIDFVHWPPPSLEYLTSIYEKSVIALPMFGAYGKDWTEISNETLLLLKRKKKRSNVVLLHSRKHIEALGEECGTDGKLEIGTCLNAGDSSKYGRAPENMHRCTGPKGGHADLLAWDVIEAVNYQLAHLERGSTQQ